MNVTTVWGPRPRVLSRGQEKAGHAKRQQWQGASLQGRVPGPTGRGLYWPRSPEKQEDFHGTKA